MAEPGVETLPDDREPLRRDLLEWYAANHREFPWRGTTDAYRVLVAEVMSQQTQLDRVVEPWTAFVERWPTVDALADADRAEVVSFWSEQRLGYNNRARYLHDAAGMIVDEFDGAFPRTPEALEALPGVGPYTANAVASFAFDAGGAVVDTNVRRVLHRAFGVADDDEAFETTAARLMPAGDSRAWNNAIMELGGTVCTTDPRCADEPCPWRQRCVAFATGDFTAPDVPSQPAFEGSRRQFRGRVVRALGAHGALGLDELGSRVRVGYVPEGEPGREWLRDLLRDLADDGLVTVDDGTDGEPVARLQR